MAVEGQLVCLEKEDYLDPEFAREAFKKGIDMDFMVNYVGGEDFTSSLNDSEESYEEMDYRQSQLSQFNYNFNKSGLSGDLEQQVNQQVEETARRKASASSPLDSLASSSRDLPADPIIKTPTRKNRPSDRTVKPNDRSAEFGSSPKQILRSGLGNS